MKKPKQLHPLAKLMHHFDGRPWLAVGVGVAMVVVIGAGAVASTRVAAMITSASKYPISIDSSKDSKAEAEPSASSSPTPTAQASATPKLDPANPGEPNGVTVGAKKQLIFSTSAFTVAVNTDTPTFTVSSPESYGICMPTVVSPQGIFIISPSNAPASGCGQSHTMQLATSKGPGTYTVKVQASTPGKVYNGNYITYEGSIQLTVRKPGFSLSTNPALSFLNGASERIGMSGKLTIVPESGYVGTPTATHTFITPGVCTDQSSFMMDPLNYAWFCQILDTSSHGSFTVMFNVTDGYTTKSIQQVVNY